MPEADYSLVDESVRENERRVMSWCRVGLDPRRVSRGRMKRRLDAMDDEAFFKYFLKLGQEHRQSLMVCEWQRRRTFRVRAWLRHDRPDGVAEEFARDGFYFVGEGDRAQCCFRSGSLGNWEPGDVVRVNHRRFFPYCKKARGDRVYNLPLASVEENRSGVERPALTPPTSSSSPFPLPGCRREVYLDLGRRHASFRLFDEADSSVAAKVARMAAAGFFYQGPGNLVRCYCCDGVLEDWRACEDEWASHARRYPTCGHVLTVKGEEFVEGILRRMRGDDGQEGAARDEADDLRLSELIALESVEAWHLKRKSCDGRLS